VTRAAIAGAMHDRRLKYWLVLPALVTVVATAVWPLADSLHLSFRVWKLSRASEPGGFVGLENYAWAVLQEPAFWNAAWVTAVYTVATVALSVIGALGIALLLAPGGRLRVTARALLVLPFAMSPALVGVSFRFMFNPEFGLFDAFFGVLLPPLAEVSWLSNPLLAFTVCVLADVWGWIPFLAMVLIGGLTSLPRETVEAAQVDGAGGWRVFRDVVLPQLVPTLAVVAILKTVFSLKAFDQIYMLTNGGPGTATQTLAHYAYFNGFKYYDMGYASAVAWMMVVPMLVLAVVYARFIFRRASS